MREQFDFHFERPEESPGYLLWQLTMKWQREVNRTLHPLGLTHTQFVIMAALAWLTNKAEHVTQSDLANHSNVDRMMVSKIIRRLTDVGLVASMQHPDDSRAKCVDLTEAGSAIFVAAIRAVEKFDSMFFGRIGPQLPGFITQMDMLVNEGREG